MGAPFLVLGRLSLFLSRREAFLKKIGRYWLDRHDSSGIAESPGSN